VDESIQAILFAAAGRHPRPTWRPVTASEVQPPSPHDPRRSSPPLPPRQCHIRSA
jgi:hypothetical protein